MLVEADPVTFVLTCRRWQGLQLHSVARRPQADRRYKHCVEMSGPTITRPVIAPPCGPPKQTNNLLTHRDVPDFAREISIHTGYRSELGYDGCIRSILSLHNETVNIWTHLLGFVFFFCMMVKDMVWSQEHIRDRTDYNATLLQLVTYQVHRECNVQYSVLQGDLGPEEKSRTQD